MSLDSAVLAALEDRPASAGKLIERLQAEGRGGLAGRAVLVYGAVARLVGQGRLAVVARSDAEVVYGAPGTMANAAAAGFPPSFSLSAQDLALAERGVYERTKNLPAHYFEELRRVVVADADRRVFHGEKLPRAVTLALDDLGPTASVRRYLKRSERGRPPTRLRTAGRRWPYVLLGVAALLVALHLLVFDVATIPPRSLSMAPALFPAGEGGDRTVVVLRYAHWFDTPSPDRGDIVVFDIPGSSDRFVKRVWGLPSETVRIEKGDLLIDGKRLVKDRALLDRVAVPLFDRDDFEPTGDGRLRQKEPAVVGFRRPDGTLETVRGGPCRDVLARVRLRFSGKGSATLELGGSGGARYTVLLSDDRFLASVSGVEAATERLATAGETELWVTNADGVFRVEIDGVERARAPVPGGTREPRFAVTLEGDVALEGIAVSRDLVFGGAGPAEAGGGAPAWRVGKEQFFVLGDNSPESRDSRVFGAVDAARLRGRALCVAWPLARCRRLK